MSDTFGQIIDGAAGTAQGREGTTVQTFVLSLAAGLVLFAVQFGAFLIVRNYFWAKRIYAPRSFLLPSKQRVKAPPDNPVSWLWKLLATSNDLVLRKAGMDGYFFIRYLGLCLKIFFPMALIIIPILIPINYVDGKGTNTIAGTRYNVTGLDTLAWSNVSPQHTQRYWAHLVLAVVVIAWVCCLFYYELRHYVVKRQEYLGSRTHRLKASATTVLITDIPKDLCTNEALMKLYDDFPGGVRRIWLNRNFESIVNKDNLRREYEGRLENAETDLIRKIVKKSRKKGDATDNLSLDEMTRPNSDSRTVEKARSNHEEIPAETIQAACEKDLQHDLATKALWTQSVRPRQRATMRIPRPEYAWASKVPLIGRFAALKVDTIYFCRRELAKLNREIETEIEEVDNCSQNGSAFIQFHTQKAAHLACQAVAHTLPGRMAERAVEMSPADINWSALNYTRRNRAVRLVIFVVLFLVLLFAFGLISFFTGLLSRVSTLADSTSWLRWIGDLPRWLISFIQGTVPPVLLVILLSGPTPIILRAMTNSTRGATTGSRGERSLQLWYFILLFFEVFFIPTISSGLTSIVQELIHNTASVPQILATNLPTAANYYFSFLILQTLSISSSSILQTIRLLNFYCFAKDNTPDEVFTKLSFTWRTRIGSNIPWYTTFAVIGLVYSIIAPLMLLFMLITFSLFYVVLKNNILYVIRTGDVDSGGVWLPSAINQTFTGLYFMEVCMIGLFFLVRDAQNQVACEAQGIIMSIAFVLTIMYQIWLSLHFNGLFRYAPIQLVSEPLLEDNQAEAGAEGARSSSESGPPEAGPTASASGITAATTEKDTVVSGKLHGMPENIHEPEESSGPTFLAENRQRGSSQSQSLHTANISRRGTDMEEQIKHDTHSAKRILARLNRPLDGARLAELEAHLVQAEALVSSTIIPRKRAVQALMMKDPISRIIMQHNDDLEALTEEERDMLVSIAFTHPVLRASKPGVWIPRDEFGVSDDEVRRTREFGKDIVIENRGAHFNRKLKVEVDKPPPDMSEFALVMAEL
jgi:calcium permeable stress-gated cation channel